MSGDPVPSDASGADPATVQTLPELAQAFQRLRGTRSYAQLDKAARPQGLARSTLSNLLNGRSTPSRETVIGFLAACGLEGRAQEPWLAAWERVTTAHLRRPDGAVRVREARPRQLGVHAPIQVEGATGELPVYVPRDLDDDLRAAVIDAAEHGGFVLLVGGSSVGKTRSMYEAIRTALPEWWLIHPDPVDDVTVARLAAMPAPRTVVWFDELQRYLGRTPNGLSAGITRRLITAGIVIVATLWPDEYGARATPPTTPGRSDLYADERQLLGLAHVIDVAADLSPEEQGRAEDLASDPRIRVALDTPDAGFTQVLAAGPELVRWWANAPDPYGKAVITAALDAHRVGARAPLPPAFLAAAAPGYLTSRQQAVAPTDWLDSAVAYATTPLRGATATLCPVAARMGQVVGYTVADYLHQHARRTRRTVALPDLTWRALVDHYHADDIYRLADSAERRGQSFHAEGLYRRVVDTHRGSFGRVGKDGADFAEYKLADLLVRHNRIEELRERADTGELPASHRLARVLAERGDIDGLRVRASTEDRAALHELANLLIGQGHIDEAVAKLRRLIDLGYKPATERLANALADRGQVEEAIAVLSEHTEIRDMSTASSYLANLLAEHRHISRLRGRADDGNFAARHRLADFLAEHGYIDELRQRADAGDALAANRLADLLAEQGNLDELRRRTDAHDGSATCERLANLLAERGEIEELRERADHGADIEMFFAGVALARLLAKRGEMDELRQRANAGSSSAVAWLAKLLAEQGNIDELREYADRGHQAAAHELIELLASEGRVDELSGEVAAGTVGAVARLSDITHKRASDRSP